MTTAVGTVLAQISQQQAHAVTANDNFQATSPAGIFGIKNSLTTGLTLAFYGGYLNTGGSPTLIADGEVTLTGSATNYVERTAAGVVSSNTSAFTSGRIPLYAATTSASAITAITDYRTIGPSWGDAPTFSSITLAAGTITSSAPAVNVTQTWNSAGTTFIGWDMNITDTASAAASLLARWRVGAAVMASISKAGAMVLAAGLTLSGAIAGATTIAASGAVTLTAASPQLTLGVLNTTSGGIKFFGSTSGNVTLAPNVAAGASVTVTLPATSVTLNAAGDLTGNTLNSGVTASSLTSLGTIAALVAGTGNFTGAFSFNSSSVFRAQTTSNVPSVGVTISNLAVDGVTEIGPDNHIILMVTRTTNSWAWFKLGAGTTIILQGSTADFSVTKDNATTINVYAEGGVTKIQNKTAGTISGGAALLAGLSS